MISQINDYSLLPLTLPPTSSFQPQIPATHTLYVRVHSPKIPTESDNRSIFIVNVPIDSTAAHLRAVISSLIGPGRFEEAVFEGERNSNSINKELVLAVSEAKVGTSVAKKRKRDNEVADIDTEAEELPKVWDRDLRRSGSSAVVVLVDLKSVELTIKAIRKLHKSAKGASKWPVWGDGIEKKVPPLGSARYLAHQRLRFPDSGILMANINGFMSSFNAREEEKARQAKKARNVPDDDGFITVARGGRAGPARKEDAEEKKKVLDEREREKREGMSTFYRFQVREQRKKEQGELVKRFEEDRERVGKMREQRGRFRPET